MLSLQIRYLNLFSISVSVLMVLFCFLACVNYISVFIQKPLRFSLSTNRSQVFLMTHVWGVYRKTQPLELNHLGLCDFNMYSN